VGHVQGCRRCIHALCAQRSRGANNPTSRYTCICVPWIRSYHTRFPICLTRPVIALRHAGNGTPVSLARWRAKSIRRTLPERWPCSARRPDPQQARPSKMVSWPCPRVPSLDHSPHWTGSLLQKYAAATQPFFGAAHATTGVAQGTRPSTYSLNFTIQSTQCHALMMQKNHRLGLGTSNTTI